jgi:hypothetical protein
MAIPTVIHVGDDSCMRIPVLEITGLRVLRSGCAESEFRTVLGQADALAAVILSDEGSDLRRTLLQSGVVETVRDLCTAPLILFRTSNNFCDESKFDLVIPPLTPPMLWLPNLLGAIEVSDQIRGQFYEEDESVRPKVRAEISRAIREANRSFLNSVWRGKPPASASYQARIKTGT